MHVPRIPGHRTLGLRGLSTILAVWVSLIWLCGDGFCEQSPEGIELEILGRVEDYIGFLGSYRA